VGFFGSMVTSGGPDDLSGPPTWQVPGWLLAEPVVAVDHGVVISAGPVKVYSTGVEFGFTVRP
jgi:hypothetical protein